MTKPTKRKAGVKAWALKWPYSGKFSFYGYHDTERGLISSCAAGKQHWERLQELGYRCVRVSITEDKS